MNKHCVYILKCSDNTFYTGYTNDLDKRVKAHNEGKGAKYTRSRLPAVLVYHEVFDTKKEAMSREWHIKHDMTREEKIKLIESSANSLTDFGSEHRMETSNANALKYIEWSNESMADDKKIEATKTEEVKAVPVEKKLVAESLLLRRQLQRNPVESLPRNSVRSFSRSMVSRSISRLLRRRLLSSVAMFMLLLTRRRFLIQTENLLIFSNTSFKLIAKEKTVNP